MLDFHLQTDTGILQLSPAAPLASRDFVLLNEVVNRYLADHNTLSGIIISGGDQPGWEDLASLIANLSFVDNRHQQIYRVAVVMDMPLGSILPALKAHFPGATVCCYGENQQSEALSWLTSAD